MFDLHTHTLFSDGKNSAEEMVCEAIRLGLKCIGFSDHSGVCYDDCGMTEKTAEEYRAEIKRLKTEYAGRIKILCGLERDYYSEDNQAYDYVIGSVHALRMEDGHYICVDWDKNRLAADVLKYFHGDWYTFAEAYYETEADVIRKTVCDIVGHFDLLTIFNAGCRLFDTTHPRYRKAWKKAADRLLEYGKTFEINTGAMSRGYRRAPYPSAEIREYLRKHGGRMILSSDAHRREHIAYAFGRYFAALQGTKG
jgi:histidinol-phosphatase (PHP family)